MKTLQTFYFFLFLLLISHSVTFAQGWQNTFGQQVGINNKILQVEGDHLLVAGTVRIDDNSSHIFIKKISIDGTLLAQINIVEEQSISLNDFIVTEDHELLGVGSHYNPLTNLNHAYCFKMSLDGEIRWTKIFDSFEISTANTAIQLTDGNYLLAGSTKSVAPEPLSFSAYMMKIDSDGTILFWRVYEEEGFDTSGDVLLETNNQEILMGGYYGYPLASPGDTFLGRYDMDGHKIWYYNDPVPTVMKKILDIGNDTYLVGGSSDGVHAFSLKAVDGLGNTVWSHLHSIISPYRNVMSSIVQLPNGDFAINGISGGLTPIPDEPFVEEFWDAVLFKTDSLGNLLFTQIYDGDENFYLSHMTTTQDGGLAMSGHAYNSADNQTQTYVIKLGNDCILSSINDEVLIIPDIKIFPNPVHETALIDLSAFQIKNGEFQLFNSLGQHMQHTHFRGTEFVFKKRDLKVGLYYFQIIDNGKVIGNGQFVVY